MMAAISLRLLLLFSDVILCTELVKELLSFLPSVIEFTFDSSAIRPLRFEFFHESLFSCIAFIVKPLTPLGLSHITSLNHGDVTQVLAFEIILVQHVFFIALEVLHVHFELIVAVFVKRIHIIGA